MRRELADQRGLKVGYGSVWRFCDREKQTYKKACAPPSKIGLTSPKLERHGVSQQPELPAEQLVFIDETWAKDNMTRLYGRCPSGQRLIDKIPLARWQTTTFLAALRHR